ncbi:MAG: class IIb bacteriocin, lactobin A/cerein 7B family [Bacilli bacterium]
MKLLKEEELCNVKGGCISIYAIIGISALFVFISGIMDGYANPTKCVTKEEG